MREQKYNFLHLKNATGTVFNDTGAFNRFYKDKISFSMKTKYINEIRRSN